MAAKHDIVDMKFINYTERLHVHKEINEAHRIHVSAAVRT